MNEKLLTETDLKIKSELERIIRNEGDLHLAAIIGSWKETQSDESTLNNLKIYDRLDTRIGQ